MDPFCYGYARIKPACRPAPAGTDQFAVSTPDGDTEFVEARTPWGAAAAALVQAGAQDGRFVVAGAGFNAALAVRRLDPSTFLVTQ